MARLSDQQVDSILETAPKPQATAPAASPTPAPAAQVEQPLKVIDWTSGAPMKLRAAVGSAETDPDREAAVRAQGYRARRHQPTGELLYRENKPGSQWRAVNPSGLDRGDFVGAAPELVGALTGGLGAIKGAAAGSVVPGPGTVAGAVTGGALGATAGRQGAAAFMRWLFDVPDTRTTGQALGDSAAELGYNAAFEGIGHGLPAVGRGAMDLGKRARSAAADAILGPIDREAAEAATNIGAPLSVAEQRKARKALAQGEVYLGQTPMGQGPAERLVERQQAAMEGAVAGALPGRPYAGKVEAGDELAKALDEHAGSLRKEFEEKYQDAILWLEDTPVKLNTLAALRNELAQQFSRTNDNVSGRPDLDAAVKYIRELLKSDKTGYEAIKGIKGSVRRRQQQALLPATNDPADVHLKRIEQAIATDLDNALRPKFPEAADEIIRVDKEYADFAEGMRRFVGPQLRRAETNPEAVGALVINGGVRAGGLRMLRRSVSPEVWDRSVATIIDGLGRAKPGQQSAAGDEFSAATFLTNWNRLDAPTKNILLSEPRHRPIRKTLRDVAVIAERVKKRQARMNTSRTGSFIAYNAIGALGAGLASGQVATGAAAGALGGLIGSRAAAQMMLRPNSQRILITDPTFTRWLRRVGMSENVPLSQHITRLGRVADKIASDDPERSGAMREYIDLVSQQMGQQGEQQPDQEQRREARREEIERRRQQGQ